MPRLVANAARVDIDLLPHLQRLGDPVFAEIVDQAVEEAYAIREREAAEARKQRVSYR